ncbi:serine/threonine protein kinase [Micromonospora sp. WMMD812]|uniref:serine/threonine-protein kinase n=1 Tax=Micromonospora sp. WMMD812 TaxID=3015152 RepID=UPI00248B9A4A|nr:serine/threonine protein kinase [Micromonospora sp. WMMD812]WBB68298.1 protein kinase [Micromonospora sp. WMMD812]
MVSEPVIEGFPDLRLVGRGGFSTVYRARQDRLGRTVAVKVLHVDLSDPRARDQFLSECAAAGRMANHPHILTVHDSGVTAAGEPYLVMEFCDRGSLADRLRAGALDAAAALPVLVKLCGALATAHRAGVLHRDLKPENVLFTGYGEPALADFGIASMSGGAHGSSTIAALTPDHAAPEVLDGGGASAASDVYSLASTAYQALAGSPPFRRGPDEGLLAYFQRVAHEPAPRLSRPGDPPELADVIARGLAKTPAERYATAEAFGQALRRVQQSAGLDATTMSIGPSPGDATPTALPATVVPVAAGTRAVPPLVAMPAPADDSVTVELPTVHPAVGPIVRPAATRKRNRRATPVLAGIVVLLLLGGVGGYLGYHRVADDPTTRQVAAGGPVSATTDAATSEAAPTPTAGATTASAAPSAPSTAPVDPPISLPAKQPAPRASGRPAASSRPPVPYVEYLRVTQQPNCPSGQGVPNPFPGGPVVIEWKVAGGATGSVLSVDGSGAYGEYGVTGTESLSFPCGAGNPGGKVTHRYTITTKGGGPQKSRSITVTARAN